MSLISMRSDFYSPSVAKKFATNTAAVLHDADAPTNCKHLPCGVMADTAASLVWKDVQGTTITTALAAGMYVPIAPAELVANASNPAVTVFWQPSIRKS